MGAKKGTCGELSRSIQIVPRARVPVRDAGGAVRARSVRRAMGTSEGDKLPSRFQGAVRGFEQTDDFEARAAVVEGCAILQDAAYEVLELDLQGFRLLDFRRPDISRAIAHEQLVDALPVRNPDAFVVHLDLLVLFEIVPDHLLLLALYQRRAYLHG